MEPAAIPQHPVEAGDGPIITPWRQGPSPCPAMDVSPQRRRLCSQRTPVDSLLVPAGLTPPQQQHLAPGTVPMLGRQEALRLNTEIHLALMEKNGEKECGQKAAGETAKIALKRWH